MQYYVYIMTNKKHGTLYIGVTNNLIKRVYQHKTHAVPGFTQKYKLHGLVYYEETESIESAITREKQLKNWKRQWKIELVDKFNPAWKDLFKSLL